jgi:flagellar biosynthetic protein FlhB
MDGVALVALMRMIGVDILAAVAIPLLLLAIGSICGNIIQHRLVWSTESLTPKLSKISPAAGAKRLFSKHGLMNFVKGLIKLVVIGVALCAVLWPERDKLELLMSFDPMGLLTLARSQTLGLMGTVVAILAVLAAGDFLFQYRTWYERQKMSLREIKDEFKDTDGDPKIKAKIRQLRMQRSRKRMMQAVPDATVVITNPTHFAVALKYERGMAAPICVAKGQDNIALKIREIAGNSNVPIVENPPLARILYATVDIDQEIPAEHYKAVAEVIGYVMRLTRRFAR